MHCEGVHISSVSGLMLSEYAAALTAHCSSSHVNPCTGCLKLIEIVYEQGYCMLPEAYKWVSWEVKYTAERARRKLLFKCRWLLYVLVILSQGTRSLL